MPQKIFILAILLFAASSFNASTASAQYDLFLYVDGAPGESQDPNHQNWIDVSSYDFYGEFPVKRSRSAGSVNSTERVSFDGFELEKHLDKSTPKLLWALAAASSFDNAALEICDRENDRRVVMKFIFEKVWVSSLVHTNAKGADPIETVTLSFETIEIHYYTYDSDTGDMVTDAAFKWDLKKNR